MLSLQQQLLRIYGIVSAGESWRQQSTCVYIYKIHAESRAAYNICSIARYITEAATSSPILSGLASSTSPKVGNYTKNSRRVHARLRTYYNIPKLHVMYTCGRRKRSKKFYVRHQTKVLKWWCVTFFSGYRSGNFTGLRLKSRL